ncbi:cytochrome b5 [Schizophyllum amplum]|uniref:Cytochrome b5 n=1 Tax=Schizophyllum amplum TaxID=97359 RepID=A0A550CQA5_9AGAR|nr:cytochrome b5 [Auriculariopsis ampla]
MSIAKLVIYAVAFIAPPIVLFALLRRRAASVVSDIPPAPQLQPSEKPKSIMQAENTNLAPPKDDPFTLEELKAFDGSDPSKPIYLSIKGTVFDVSAKRDVYGPGRSYGIFAGKDPSKGLGMSSLKPENAVPEYEDLNEGDRKVLDDWHGFFTKRYNIVGRVVDHPTHLKQGNAPSL